MSPRPSQSRLETIMSQARGNNIPPHTSQYLANTTTLPSGNVASSCDSNSSGPRSASLKGESSKSENLNVAPIRFTECPSTDTSPVVASAFERYPLSPLKIGVASPCISSEPTSPTATSDLFTCHSFSLRNATSQETLFIGFAHFLGATQARYLAAKFHWQFQRPLRELLAVTNELDRNCNARNAKRKRPSNSPAASRKRSSGA